MTIEQVKQRLDELSQLAKKRMDTAPSLKPSMGYGILWLTRDEVAEHHELVQLLISLEDNSAESARKRIQEKINKRKSKIFSKSA